MARFHGLIARMRRLVRFRLVVPLKRSKHSPEFTARGVMIGVFWALTPLVGIQMFLVVLTWLAVRWTPRLDFHLLVALAWTWVTNVFTALPSYYVFYMTGVMMMGRLEDTTGYTRFVAGWEAAFTDAESFTDKIGHLFELVITEQGFPMAIGCLPFALGCAWLGYRWTLRFLHAWHHTRRRAAVVARRSRRDRAKVG